MAYHRLRQNLSVDREIGEGTYSRITLQNRAARTRAVFYMLGILACIGWAYVCLMSDAFLIERVDARGLQALDPVDVSREVLAVLDARAGWRPWPARHAWFVDRIALANALTERLFAERVVIEKTSGNVLRLMIEERANRLVLHSHQQLFWVDLQGVALRELNAQEQQDVGLRLTGSAPHSSLKDAPIIHFDLDEPLADNFHVAEAADVKSWIRTASEVRKAGIEYREIQPPLSASNTSAIILTKEGFPMLVDYFTELKPQLEAYKSFEDLVHRNKTPVTVKEYVDVRVPGRIYFK